MSHLIGLIGPKGSGKSTIAEYLVANHHVVVVDDVQSVIEMKAIREQGGKLIYLLRPGIDIPTDTTTLKPEDADLIFRNRGTPQEVCNLLMTVLNAGASPDV